MLDDEKLVAKSDSREFWVMFKGFAPIVKNNGNDVDARIK